MQSFNAKEILMVHVSISSSHLKFLRFSTNVKPLSMIYFSSLNGCLKTKSPPQRILYRCPKTRPIVFFVTLLLLASLRSLHAFNVFHIPVIPAVTGASALPSFPCLFYFLFFNLPSPFQLVQCLYSHASHTRLHTSQQDISDGRRTSACCLSFIAAPRAQHDLLSTGRGNKKVEMLVCSLHLSSALFLVNSRWQHSPTILSRSTYQCFNKHCQYDSSNND